MAGRMHGLVAKDERPMAAVKSMVATSSIQVPPVRTRRRRDLMSFTVTSSSRDYFVLTLNYGCLHTLASATHGQLRASLALLALRG